MELFDKKLMQVGYVDADKHRYQAKYAVRNEYIYQINEKFPAITSENLDDCLYDVSYRIMLEGCAEWNIQKELLFRELAKFETSSINVGSDLISITTIFACIETDLRSSPEYRLAKSREAVVWPPLTIWKSRRTSI